MPIEIKVEDAKKELEGVLNKEKSAVQKSREAQMSEVDKKSLETKQAEDKKKAEETRIQAEAQAKKDAELLTKKDEEITVPEDKKRKTELLEKQRKSEEDKLSAEEKIKRIQEGSQKRIDEVINRLKEVEDKTSKEAESLRKELATLREEKNNLEKRLNQPAEKVESIVQKQEKERIVKYLQEDKDKSREERREMSKDELESWFLEDMVSAQEWVADRTLRRQYERITDANKQKRDERTKNFITKQEESSKRVLLKHPDLDMSKREGELKAQGKTDGEIQATLCQEDEKYRICAEIVRENPEKYLANENGPELVAAELDKRLGKQSTPGNDEKDKEIEELKKQIETLVAQVDTLVNPADEGIVSTVAREKARKIQATEGEKILIQTMRDAKASQDMIDKAVKNYREKIGKNA